MTIRPVWPPPHVKVHGSVATMDLDPDLQLLTAWQGGDKRAADSILIKYYTLVRRTVLTKVPEGAVDDVVQDVFEALVERRDSFRADAKLKTFVLTIVRNKIADYFRKRKTTDQVDVLATSVRDLGAGPSSLLLKHENDRLLLEALRSIQLDDQLVLELHYWDDMSGPELCQVFECSEPAIRGRIRRAKERLNSELQALSRDHRELADTVTDLHAWAKKLRDGLEPYLQQLKRDKRSRN